VRRSAPYGVTSSCSRGHCHRRRSRGGAVIHSAAHCRRRVMRLDYCTAFRQAATATSRIVRGMPKMIQVPGSDARGHAHAIDDMYQGPGSGSVPTSCLTATTATWRRRAWPWPRRWAFPAAAGLAARDSGSGAGWRAGVSWRASARAFPASPRPTRCLASVLLLASGPGAWRFPPAAGKSARADAGGSASAMSIFAAGGSAGFFLAPVPLRPALVPRGWRHSLCIPPPCYRAVPAPTTNHRRPGRAGARA